MPILIVNTNSYFVILVDMANKLFQVNFHFFTIIIFNEYFFHLS